jgi:hypothetical protein
MPYLTIAAPPEKTSQIIDSLPLHSRLFRMSNKMCAGYLLGHRRGVNGWEA